MAKIEFYNVKKKKKVQIDESNITKTTYEKESAAGKKIIRYAFRSVDDGTNVTKFVNKETYDSVEAPVT